MFTAERHRRFSKPVPKAKGVSSLLLSPGFLPTDSELSDLLSVSDVTGIGDLFETALLNPIRDLAARPGKKFRSRLVELGHGLVSPNSHGSARNRRRCRLGGEAVELIHAGSLVIDDIEDGSLLRRGELSLHRRYGLPVALNAGNWLYFWPFEILKKIGLAAEQELLIDRYYNRTLLKAHFGQALDVGLRMETVDQPRVPGVSLAAMELKTGALIAFALIVGAVLAGGSTTQISQLETFGLRLGVALQMFDDLGNLHARTGPGKRLEDLALRRASWVWAFAAEHCAADAYREFVRRVQLLPEACPLMDWFEESQLIARAKERALCYLNEAHSELERAASRLKFGHGSLAELRALGREVSSAYD